MAVREIISYFEHSDLLRKTSQPVQIVDRRIVALIRDLKDTLKANPDGVLFIDRIRQNKDLYLVQKKKMENL